MVYFHSSCEKEMRTMQLFATMQPSQLIHVRLKIFYDLFDSPKKTNEFSFFFI